MCRPPLPSFSKACFHLSEGKIKHEETNAQPGDHQLQMILHESITSSHNHTLQYRSHFWEKYTLKVGNTGAVNAVNEGLVKTSASGSMCIPAGWFLSSLCFPRKPFKKLISKVLHESVMKRK